MIFQDDQDDQDHHHQDHQDDQDHHHQDDQDDQQPNLRARDPAALPLLLSPQLNVAGGGVHDDDDGDNDKRVITSGRGNDLIISTEHMLGPGKGYNYILCQNIIYHRCDH